ncbi:MAG TPA: hypothetical protein VK973_06975 [Arenicellales bacterium]|nr:hypothetical protein [Arenicellales bacterium]
MVTSSNEWREEVTPGRGANSPAWVVDESEWTGDSDYESLRLSHGLAKALGRR